MRFTDGLWMHRSGLSIHNTHQMWEYRIEQDRIKAFVLCHCVEEADDYTAGTALEYTFSCPAPDMIAVDVVHFRGSLPLRSITRKQSRRSPIRRRAL